MQRDDELLQEYEHKWDNCPGDNFDKALEIIRDYSGYNDFFAVRKGRTFAAPIREAIAKYYGENGLRAKYKKTLCCDIKYLIFQVNKAITVYADENSGIDPNLNKHGHLYAVFSVIQNKTGITIQNFDRTYMASWLYDFYFHFLDDYIKNYPHYTSYESILFQNLAWIANGRVPLTHMLRNKMIDKNTLITIIELVISRNSEKSSPSFFRLKKLIHHCTVNLEDDDQAIVYLFQLSLDKKAIDAARAILITCSNYSDNLNDKLLNCLVDYYETIEMDTLPEPYRRVLPENGDAVKAVEIALEKNNKNALIIFLDNMDFCNILRNSISYKIIVFANQHTKQKELVCLVFSLIWGSHPDFVKQFLNAICPNLDKLNAGTEILITTLEKICDLKCPIYNGQKPYLVTDKKYIYFDKNDAYELLCQRYQLIPNWNEVESCFINRLKPDVFNTLMIAIGKFSFESVNYLLSTKKIDLARRYTFYDLYEIQKSICELSLLQAPIFMLEVNDPDTKSYQHAKEIISLLVKYDKSLVEMKDSKNRDINYHIAKLKKSIKKTSNKMLIVEMEKIINKERFYNRARIFFFGAHMDKQPNMFKELTKDVGAVIMKISKDIYRL